MQELSTKLALARLLDDFDLPDQERANYLIEDLGTLDAECGIEHFLDMGAGSGSMSAVVLTMFPNSHGVLVDVVSRLQIKEYLPSLDDNRYETVGFAELAPIVRDNYDLVLFMDVIEHIPDWKSALRGLFGRVRSGGYLYVQAPSNYPSPNWPTRRILKNKFLGFLGKNDPSQHVRHGMSCKAVLDYCSPTFVPLIAAEDYTVNGKLYCTFKPRTHLLLKKI